MTPPNRFSLQWRVSIVLVMIVLMPFGLSYVMLDQVGRSAANYTANEATAASDAMTKSLDVYRDLFETTKRLHAEIADRLSRRPDLIALDPHANLTKILADEAASQANLRGLAMLRDDGTVVAEAGRPLDAHEQKSLREKVVDQPLAAGGAGGTLRLTFAVSDQNIEEGVQRIAKLLA